MAIVRRKLRSGKVSYWIKFSWNGGDVWERAGTNEREAKALEAQRKREVAAGTYTRERTGRVTVEAWFSDWFAGRSNRTVENDRALIDRHVLSIEWFAKMAVQETRTKHLLRLVEEIRKAGRLGEKSISTVYGVVASAFRRAQIEELIHEDITKLPRGTLTRKTAPGNRRKPYQRAEMHALLTCGALRPDTRIFVALAFFTGMREGEICGRRWRDWDRSTRPLGALSVHSQYDDQPLKGDAKDKARPRMVPVHPELAELLAAWWDEGFELVHRRRPTPEDFIVPQANGTNHTKSSGYKLFQRALDAAGVQNRSLHSTRHAFVSIARSNGARPDVLERVTHNASGETIDDYTTFEWRALCEAVARVDADVDPIANQAVFAAPEPGLEAGADDAKSSESDGTGESDEEPPPARFSAHKPLPDAWFDARHRRALKLAEIDTEAARPELAIYRGLAATRAGDEGSTRLALEEAAEALGFVAKAGGS